MDLMEIDLAHANPLDPDGPAWPHVIAFAEANRKAALNLLPETIRRAAQEFGFAVALKIVFAYGGTEVWLPASDDRPSAFVARMAPLIGEEKAREFPGLFGYGALQIPTCTKFVTAFRRHLIRQSDAAGGSASAAARRAGVTIRTVHRQRHDRRAGAAQT